MKLISIISCIFLIFLATAYADEEVIKCIDADGNTILTSSPQDGMKCFVEKKEEPKKEKVNLVEYCAELNTRSKDIQEQREDIEKQINELRKQLNEVRRDYMKSDWDEEYAWRQAKPLVDRIERLGEQSTALYKRNNEICEEIKSYKCNQMSSDMSRIQSQTGSGQSRNRGYRK
jgi:chromosome segregation ATPase